MKMMKTHFQQPVFCKQSIYALLICNDQIPLHCTNVLNGICLQFANIKHRKKILHRFQIILKRSPYKCQIFPDRKTLCYIVEFQTNFENMS